MNQKDLNFFIKKSNSIFGEWFDFSKSIYINNSTNLTIICPEHGSFDITPSSFYKQGCFKCKRHIRTIKLISKANLKFNYGFDYSKVKIGAKRGEEVIIGCPNCGDMIYTLGRHLQSKGGCSYCAPTRKQDLIEIIARLDKHWNSLYKYPLPQPNYKNVDSKLEIICAKHGSFYKNVYNHIGQNQGCPRCNRYVGEAAIDKYLLANQIKFETQKRFEDCRNKKPLPFDFYISDKNLLIEYDGTPHFKPIDIFGGQEYFEIIQKHDKIKTDYCLKEGIILERINYKENIEERLKEILCAK